MTVIKKEYGSEHAIYASMLSEMGAYYRGQKKTVKAERFYKRCLEIYKKELGNRHILFASGLNNLGNLYIQKKMYAEAEKNLLEAKRLYETQVDYRTPHYYITLNNLGLSELGLGDQEKAARMFRAAAKACEKIYGKGHEDYKMIIRHLQATEGEKM